MNFHESLRLSIKEKFNKSQFNQHNSFSKLTIVFLVPTIINHEEQYAQDATTIKSIHWVSHYNSSCSGYRDLYS